MLSSIIWYHYDRDKSGYLEKSELKGFIRDFLLRSLKFDDKITPQVIDERTEKVLETFDKNKDGKIEISELAKFLNVQDNFLMKFKNENDALSAEQFDAIFNHYDTDGNGYIEDVELLAFLRDLLQNKRRDPTSKDLEMYRSCILEISDKDNDGKLSKAELKILLIPNK
ncbi:secretagogin-like [Clytia hemisphaerica]|uniref:secretagogin-like n=1 Tax=Clytia hemisphaerica TaxID=252671 RepID=UPI0034D70511